MRPFIFIYCFLAGVMYGCKSYSDAGHLQDIDRHNIAENDTTTVLRIAIDTALAGHHIPDRSFLNKIYFCKDTVILCTNNSETAELLARLFPADRKLLFMTLDEICSNAIYYQSTGREFPNFLEIVQFEHVNDIYQISFQNTCVSPRRIESEISTGTLVDDGENTHPCVFGMLCGGGFNMRIMYSNGKYDSEMGGRWSD